MNVEKKREIIINQRLCEDSVCPSAPSTELRFHSTTTLRLRAGLTGHPVEEAFCSSVVGLQDFAVQRPVEVCDEAGGFTTFAYLQVDGIKSKMFLYVLKH